MTKKCTTTNNLYDNVEHCPGEISLPGMRTHFYYIRRSDIVKWPTLPMNSAESLEKNPVYDGDFTLAADAKWKKADLIPNESEPKTEQTGVYGSKHFNNTATLVLPGTQEKVTGLINELNNDDVVMLLPQRDGKYRVFGNPDFELDIKPSQAWGKGTSDTNSTTIEITDENRSAAPFYPGKIETDEGDISGATGELITTTSSTTTTGS
jgi:hypothetical protein